MSKPASGASLDTGHALYTNLAAVWGLLEGSGGTSADSKGSRTLTLNSGSWSTDADGAIWHLTSSAATNPMVPASSLTTPSDRTTKWSIFFRAKQASADTQGMVAGDNTTTSDYIWLAGHANILEVRINGGTFDFTSVTTTTVHDYLLVHDPTDNGGGGYLRLYVDGVENASSPQGEGGGAFPLLINTLGFARSGSGNALVGDLGVFYVWTGRALTSTDASTLHANPYVIFTAGGGGGGSTRSSRLALMGVA